MVSKCRVINGEYIVKISRGIVELVYEVKPFGFLEGTYEGSVPKMRIWSILLIKHLKLHSLAKDH